VLTRGYSIVTLADGSVVTTAAQVVPGSAVGLRFQYGSAQAQILARDAADDSAPK
jgi:exonuclease VII large subunit